MKIRTWIKYNEGYLPPRCRKLRYKEGEEYVDATLKEVSSTELKKAFDSGMMIYSYDGRLWTQAYEKDIHCVNGESTMTALEALIYAHVTYSSYFGKYKGYCGDESTRENRDEVIKRLDDDMNSYILVDGVLYREAAEPMYNITVFGLGFNHGGTGMFVDYHYNPNLSKESYFNALQYEEAIDYAIKTAEGRGDTIDAARFKKYKSENYMKIEVFDESLVTRNPKEEHGDGNSFLNTIEDVIKASDSPTEAGILAMAVAGSLMSK